jgi:hypothetical protein
MNRYQLKITSGQLSIRPYFSYLLKIRLFVYLFLLIFCLLPFIHHLLTSDILLIVIILGGILLFYIVFDYLFHASVVFLFDKETRSIYKLYGKLFKRRLMAFEEMTIITNDEYGSKAYSIGRKKHQFVKNYIISDTFSNSKKGMAREAAYVEQILTPILEFVKT